MGVGGYHHYNMVYTTFINGKTIGYDTPETLDIKSGEEHIEGFVKSLLIWNFEKFIKANIDVHPGGIPPKELKIYFSKLHGAVKYFLGDKVTLKEVCDFIIILEDYMTKITDGDNKNFLDTIIKTATKYSKIWVPLIEVN